MIEDSETNLTSISHMLEANESEKLENDKSKDVSNEIDKLCTGLEEIEQKVDNVTNFLETISNQQTLIEESNTKIQQLEEKCTELEKSKDELKSLLESATKQKDLAVKHKESMVIKYAVSEKNVLEQKQQKEQCEKKFKEIQRENEILQHKVQTMSLEKSRICQMLDNKCYEHKTIQQELERTKADLNALETKLKWSQNSLKTEIELHKKSQTKVEGLSAKLQEINDHIEETKREAEESIKHFHTSQENKAYVLDQQLKENQATLILIKHEKDDREQQTKCLQLQLEKLQNKQMEMLQENNELSLKVQQLERDRLENEQKLSELRTYSEQQRQDTADLQTKTSQLDQLKLQLKTEQDHLEACRKQIDLLKQRNGELETDMVICREREAEMLLFTQQLTDKNVRLQSEFTALETKVQQLTCEQTLLKRTIKEHETKGNVLSMQLNDDRIKYTQENEMLIKNLNEMTKMYEKYKQEAIDQKGENTVIKRKLELSLREVTKELQQCRKRLELYESLGNTSSSSSNSSLNVAERANGSPTEAKVVPPEGELDKQTLIDHIVKLHRINAKKSEKLDFLEEHVNTLVIELQKKTRLLQTYILRDQSGTLTSNSMDNNKAKLAKLNGIMASMYSSRIVDNNLTLELSLDINRKLQAVLEDALLKNITLKENVETLGKEIDRLNNLLKVN